MGSTRFILGRAGTGKSRFIQEQIVGLLRAEPVGPPVYLVVPRQATFIHERHYALNTGLNGYARLRVVGFDDLGDDVLAECGGEALREVTPVGRQMLLGHLLRLNAEQLHFFGSVARQTGLVRELDRTFAEFERAGRSSSEMLEALPDLLSDTAGPEYAALLEKTRDLVLLGDAYAKALGPERLDATRRLERVLANLDGCRSLRQAHLFVDGFYRFSAFERKLLARLAVTVRQTQITLTLDPQHEIVTHPDHEPDETDVFHQSATAYRQLVMAMREENVAIDKPMLLEKARRFASPALRLIEHDWPSPRPSRSTGIDASAVTLLEAPDPRAEADAAARQVKDWTDAGIRLRDIVVLCRDLSTRLPVLEAAFREHGLAYFVDRRRPASHHPLVRFVRSLLRVATAGWPHEAVMDLCKCGLAGMELDDADALENYVLEHRIHGRRAWTQDEPWAYRNLDVSEEDGLPPIAEDAARVDGLRRTLAEAIEPLSELLRGEARPVTKFITALWNCLERFQVRERLSRQIDEAEAAHRLEEAGEHRQAWEELINLFDQAADLLGGETIEAADFVSTLEYGLDLLDLAITPPAADEVILGDVERTRTIDCRAAVVLGLNDGVFPRSNADPTVLADEERRLLRTQGVDVEPDGRALQHGERFLAYLAFTRPSDKLTLLRTASDGEGRETSPSPFWEHVRRLLNVEPQAVAREESQDPECLGTPRQLVTMLMRWAREEIPEKERLNSPLAGLYQHLATHEHTGDALGIVRRRSWRALSYTNAARLRPETARELFGDTLYTSVSRLETFAACPFKHYASHVLKLRGRDEQDVTVRDIGTIYHGVLEQLIRRCISEKLDFRDKTAVPTAEMLPQLTREVGEALRGRIMLGSARNEYLLRRIETTLEGVVAGQQAMLGRGVFEPLETELKFGEGPAAKLPPLEVTTQRGRRVRLYGQIDRLDRSRDGHSGVVVDYKFSGRSLRLDHVMYGLSLQLLLYMLVLQRHGKQLWDPAPQPAAGLYVKLLRGFKTARHPDDADDPSTPVFDLREKPRGVIDLDALPHLDAEYYFAEKRSGWSEAFNAAISKDGEPYKSSGNDLVTAEQLDALLAEVEHQTMRLADELMEGSIDVRPYKMGTTSPCSHCDFRSVCRFDPATDEYLVLDPMKPQDVLAKLCGDDDEGGEA